MTYQIGVDVGATFTTAAVCRAGRAEVVPLGSRTASVPSVAFAGADGSLLLGEEAERQALRGADRVARLFTRRVGDGTPLLVGGPSGIAVTADVLTARFVSHIVSGVSSRLGSPATAVALTHPAGWGHHRLASLRAALTAHGLGTALFLSGAQAAALADCDRLPEGALVAMYDLGGSSLDAALLRRTADGRFAPAGRPEELELGGLDLDELVFDHVRSALGEAWTSLDPTDPAVLAAVAGLRRACTTAKETLSADTETRIPVALPGIDTGVRLTRLEFEELARPVVEETAAALARAVGDAEPDAVLLTGGSARIPLVTQVVSAQLGRPVTVATDPRGGTAVGAALAVGRPAEVVEPTRVALRAVPDGRTAPEHTPERPPLPVVAPPEAAGRRRLPRTLVASAAAAVMAAAVAGAIALVNYNGPSGADADPEPAGTTSTSTVTTVPTTTTTAPPPETVTEQPRRQQPRRTEQPTEETVAETTSEPPESTESTTSEPASEPSSPPASGEPLDAPTDRTPENTETERTGEQEGQS